MEASNCVAPGNASAKAGLAVRPVSLNRDYPSYRAKSIENEDKIYWMHGRFPNYALQHINGTLISMPTQQPNRSMPWL
jgi:hypothetical protein